MNSQNAQQSLNAALQHHAAGRPRDAEQLLRQILARHPDLAEAHNHLGLALRAQGRTHEAIAAYRQAIALQPDSFGFYSNLGNALRETGQVDAAIEALRHALALRPDYPETHNNLSIALREKEAYPEAIAACRQAIALNPRYAQAYNNLGLALKENGQVDEAIAAYHQAAALNPKLPAIHSNLANALCRQERYDEAVAACNRALALAPQYPHAFCNLGNALKGKGQLDAATASYRQALALQPDFADAHLNLADALKEQGFLDVAIASYRAALAPRPNHPQSHSNLIFTMLYHPVFDAQALAEVHRSWAQQHAEPLRNLIRPHTNDRQPDRRLKIGYVSPDFRQHPVAHCLLALFPNHDRTRVEVFAYAQVPTPDALTARLRTSVDHWRDTVGLSDAQMAQAIVQDHIDILVDLALHTGGNRLLVFARKPAPVQLTFAGYPGTTGLDTIDYRLTDPYLDPPGEDPGSYSEESWRLPETFWCVAPQAEEPAVGPLPALENKYVTFGCLNNFCKINDAVLQLWAQVLTSVKGSRLLLLAQEGSHRQRSIDVLARQGVTADHVQFLAPRSHARYLALYHQVDIAFDTLPYNGHMTSLDSFWMGVPVITLVGNTVVGRAGLSQLTNLHLPELAASTPGEFVSLAVSLARDLPRLRALRAGLRQRMKQSPLIDGGRFTQNIEAAYRAMWQKWCAHR